MNNNNQRQDQFQLYIIKHKSLFLGGIVFLYALLLSTQLGKHFFFPFSYLSGIRVDYLSPTLYITDILSFVLLTVVLLQSWGYLIHNGKKIITKQVYWIVAIGVLICTNYLFSLSKELWIYSFLKGVEWIGVFLFFKKNTKNTHVFQALFWGLLLGAMSQLLLSVYQLSLRHSIQGIFYWFGERRFAIYTPGIAKASLWGHEFLRPYGTFSHPNSLAGFYLLTYAFLLTHPKLTNTLLKAVALIASSALVIISFSRTAIVGYVLINLLFFFREKRTCLICQIAKIGVSLFLVAVSLSISGDVNSMIKRLDFLQKAIAIIVAKPLFGTGIGSYLIAQHTYPQKFSLFFEQPVHNIFLLSIAQLGILLPVVCALWLFSTLNIRIFRAHGRQVAFFIPFIVVVFTGSIDHYWLTLQQNLLITAVIFGTLIDSYEKQTS